MLRWYVMPVEFVADPGGGGFHRPQFLNVIAPTAAWSWLKVNEIWALGWAELTVAEHNSYNASAGVLFLTDDLEALLTAPQVTGVRTRLAARDLPSAWVDTTDSWRQVIKRIFGFIQCVQRYFGETRQSLNVGVPVTRLISALPQTVQDKLDVVASTFPSGVLPAVDHVNDTMETMFMRWSDALILRPVFVGRHPTLGQISL